MDGVRTGQPKYPVTDGGQLASKAVENFGITRWRSGAFAVQTWWQSLWRKGRRHNLRMKIVEPEEMIMTTTMLLRIAAVISLLFAAGHSLGGLKRWSPMGENEVLSAMSTVRFETMGVNRTYLDFFMGFGWSLSVAMLLQSMLLWQMASLARADAAQLRPIIATFALAALATGVIAWRFIFPVPALFSGVLLIVLAAAFVVAR